MRPNSGHSTSKQEETAMGSKPAHPPGAPEQASSSQPSPTSPCACARMCPGAGAAVSSGINWLPSLLLDDVSQHHFSSAGKTQTWGLHYWATGTCKPHPTLLISHRVPLGENTRCPGLLMSALAQLLIPERGEHLGAAGAASPWRWPRLCATVPAQRLQLPQRREGATSCSERPAAPASLALRNSPGRRAYARYTGRFPDKVCFFFFLNRLFTKHILCLQRQSTSTQG